MTTDSAAQGARARRPGGGIGLWPPPRDAWIAIAGVALLYVGHLLYGALISDAALSLGVVAAALVLGAMTQPRLRDDLIRLRGLTAPTALFVLVIAVALWTLTPWTPGGPHPIWAYVGVHPGASTIDKSATLIEIIKLLGLACFFMLGAITGGRDDRARFAVRVTLAAGVLFCLWAFIGGETGAIIQTGGRRLEAHFYNPNTAGTFFAVLFVLGLGEFSREWRNHRPRERLVGTAPFASAMLLFLVCLIGSASRGAGLSMLGALVVFGIVQLATRDLKISKALLAAIAAVALLALVISLTGEQLIDRFFHSEEAKVVRSSIWAAHWQAFLASPLFGYGLGSAETINRTLITPDNYGVLWNIRAILNVYLQWLEEAGLVGAAPMFLCIGAILLATVRGVLRRSRATTLLAALLAADAVFLFHGATDFGLEVTSIAAFWAWLLGLQFSLAQGSSKR